MNGLGDYLSNLERTFKYCRVRKLYLDIITAHYREEVQLSRNLGGIRRGRS